MTKEESTPMTTLFEYIEDGSKLHSIVSMKSLFLQHERVWLAKHLSWDGIIKDLYKNEE